MFLFLHWADPNVQQGSSFGTEITASRSLLLASYDLEMAELTPQGLYDPS